MAVRERRLPVLSVLGAATAPARAAVAAACGPTYSVFASQSGAAGVAALTAVTSLARATFALGTVVATLAALPCQYAFAKALIGAKAFAAWSVAVAAPALAAGAVKAAAFALAALTAAKYGSLASIAAQKAGVLAALLGDWARLLLEQLGGLGGKPRRRRVKRRQRRAYPLHARAAPGRETTSSKPSPLIVWQSSTDTVRGSALFGSSSMFLLVCLLCVFCAPSRGLVSPQERPHTKTS